MVDKFHGSINGSHRDIFPLNVSAINVSDAGAEIASFYKFE